VSPHETPARVRFVEIVWVLAILLTGNLLGAALVFLWVSLTRTPFASLGFVRPRSIARTIAFGIVGGVALKLLLKAAIMPALGFEAVNPAYRHVTGNPSALWRAMLLVVVGGGFGEETIWRGFLFDRLRWFSGGRLGPAPIVLVTAAAFAAAHYADQGLPGVVQAVMTGLTLGAIYVRSGHIWAPMIVHATYDITALLIIYWDLESTVAHLLLR
jgi:hypothetical protein